MINQWKMMLTVVFIIVVFSFFYIQVKQEIETYPSLSLQTETEDIEVVNSIVLYGDYQTENSVHSFSVNLEDTTYVQQMPYLERLSGFYKNHEFERLKDSYPAYMRGKEGSLSTFTENELYVVQVDTEWGDYNGRESTHIAFNLSVLHKGLTKQARFNIPIPEADQESFISLEDMFAVGDQLHLVTSHFRNIAGKIGVYELRIYTVQLDRGKIVSSDVVYTWNQESPSDEIMMTSIENKYSIIAGQRMLLLKRIVQEDVEIEDELKIEQSEFGEVSHEVLTYDFRTKNLEIYPLPSHVNDGARFISYENNSDIYMIQEDDGNLAIIEWKLGSDEQPEPIVVPTSGSVKSSTTSLIGERLYVYVEIGAHSNSIGELHVLNVPTGEWEYMGEVTLNRPLKDDERISIDNIDLFE